MSITSVEVHDLQWRKARRSAGNGACVEVAPSNGQILVRDSTDPSGPVLRYSASAFRALVYKIRQDDPSA